MLFIYLTAICSQGCDSNRGSCVSPNRCQCSTGWTGSTCVTGTSNLWECVRSMTFSVTYSYSSILPLPYIVILEICISFFGTGLVRTKFMLYWLIYSFHGNIDYLENHIQPKHQSFSNNWHNFRIGQIKERLLKCHLKMLGMV